MARIRTIKPEFPQSETIGKLSRDGRLLFVQIWTIVDDAGRTRAASRMLASLLYPYDDDARDLMDGWLDELEDHGLIRRYEVEGSTYLEVTNWLEHQKIDKPSASRLPAFANGSPKPREDSRSVETDLGPRTSTLDPTIRSVAVATRPKVERWDEFKKEMPKRKGPNPWKPAYEVYERHVRNGIPEQTMIDGAKRLSAEHRRQGNYGTEFVVQAVTWLRQQRWGDDEPAAPSDAVEKLVFVAEGSPQHTAWNAHWVTKHGVSMVVRDYRVEGELRRGRYLESEWPPNGQNTEAA